MKKILLILLAVMALGCESRTESSDRGKDADVEHTADPAESDHSIHNDTTTSGGMNRPNPYDTL